jgi:hypothetical protein
MKLQWLQNPSEINGDNLREVWWGRCGLDVSGSKQGPVMDSYEHGNELSSSTKGGEFLD